MAEGPSSCSLGQNDFPRSVDVGPESSVLFGRLKGRWGRSREGVTPQAKTQAWCWLWSVHNRHKGGVPAGPQVLVGKAPDWEGASLLHAWPCLSLWEVVESLTRSEPSSICI